MKRFANHESRELPPMRHGPRQDSRKKFGISLAVFGLALASGVGLLFYCLWYQPDPPPTDVTPVTLRATAIESNDLTAFVPSLVDEGAKPVHPTADFCAVLCMVLTEPQRKLVFQAMPSVNQGVVATEIPAVTCGSGRSAALAFGAWRAEIRPTVSEDGHTIFVESAFAFDGQSMPKEETPEIWNGHTLCYQLFQEGEPIALLLVRLEAPPSEKPYRDSGDDLFAP